MKTSVLLEILEDSVLFLFSCCWFFIFDHTVQLVGLWFLMSESSESLPPDCQEILSSFTFNFGC